MSAPAGHPQKTELGLDELRRRTRGLSQRHRTMLLLVNGQRSRSEVLSLASQAGVGVEFFDELVSIGMVDANDAAPPRPPRRAEPVAPAQAAPGASAAATPVPSRPAALAPVSDAPAGPTTTRDNLASGAASISSWSDAASTVRARLEPTLAPPPPLPSVPAAVPTPTPTLTPKTEPSTAARAPAAIEPTLAEPAVEDRIERAIALALAKRAAPREAASQMPSIAERTPPAPARTKRTPPQVPTLDDAVPEQETRPSDLTTPSAPGPLEPETAGAARVKFSGTAHKPPKPASRRHASGSRRDEPGLTPAKPPPKSARMRMTTSSGPLDDAAEERVLAEVRNLLISTLLVDGPVTSSLTALRVRKAHTRFDLTALVWEIERTLVRARRPREAQARLAKARDLLGLGNTVVDEETSPDFPHTSPPSTR